MNKGSAIGVAVNPKRVVLECQGKSYNGAIKEYKPGRDPVKCDYVVSFLPKVKKPSKIEKIVINGIGVGVIIKAIPSEYTSGFWLYYVEISKEE